MTLADKLKLLANSKKSSFGRGWWYDENKDKIIPMDPGSLGPHGDHDGWLTIGDNAKKLGVDKGKAEAFQNGVFAIDTVKYPQFKPFLEEDEKQFVFPNMLGDDVNRDDFEHTFKGAFGVSTEEAATFPSEEAGHLWRIRDWGGGHLSISNARESPLRAHASQVIEAVNRKGLVGKSINQVTIGGEGDMETVTGDQFRAARSYKDISSTGGANCGTGAGGFQSGNTCAHNAQAIWNSLLQWLTRL